jgi:hypothetical protein
MIGRVLTKTFQGDPLSVLLRIAITLENSGSLGELPMQGQR